MTTPFGDMRVLEMAGGVGVAWAAKLFADLGADVARVERSDDMVRSRPHQLHSWLNTNKSSLLLDQNDDELRERVERADLIIHNLPAAAADAAGMGASLLDRRPSVVVLAMTPFGQTGPYAGFQAEELNLIHGSSWGNVSPADAVDPSRPPLKAPGHHATINVATMAATVAMAALDKAARTGAGDHIDFSMFAAAAKLTEFAPAAVSFLGAEVTRLGRRTVTPWGIFACADGLMQVIVPEQTQWESLVQLMRAPEWAVMEIFATAPDRSANADLLNLYFSEWMATQEVEPLYRAAHDARVAMTPVNSMAQLDANEHFAERAFFATSPAGVKLPGPGAQFDRPWWGLRKDAPDLGSSEGVEWRQRPPSEDAPSAPPGRPLEGVRICDFTWVWAGPFCTQLLGHLGADVVRLESADHSCMFRRLPFTPQGHDGDLDASGSFQIYNSDKRSFGIDLGHAESHAIVGRIVASSDVVIDNFGVGTMAGLGFGVDDLRSLNPSVVVASLSGYGQTGPSASYMAYGPAGGAMAGLYAANGYGDGDDQVWETGVAIGDPGTGITAAWAIVAALFARTHSGESAVLDVAMVEAVAATIGEGWMAFLANGISPEPMGNHDPHWAPHNCYRAAGDDQWITIACTSDEMWRTLEQELAADGVVPAATQSWSTAGGRKADEGALDAALGAWTSAHDKWNMARRLQAVGVTAFPSLAPVELWRGDPHLEALGFLERPEHPITGSLVVPGVPWTTTRAPNGLQYPAPLLGQHTVEVLQELDFDQEQIAGLLERGVVTAPAESVEPDERR
jgi:crotonobetainyl-CoA:carnitine CoA-transferase CaiB-like acyl-CoA transferase